jgi:tetratricopeptide (TPR) repeat protein
MIRWLSARVWPRALVAFLLVSPAFLMARQHDEHAPPEAFTKPIDLYTVGLGPFKRPISSKNAEAQAYFNQGLQLTYAFAKPEAVRSFREAETRDPTCAVCFWGEALAWGSDLNWTMSAAEAPFAYAAAQKAVTLAAANATPVERALVQALATRYVEHFDEAKRRDQDRAFADAMGKVAADYPDDLDVATIYAEALFLLEPRAGTRDLANPNVQRIMGVLERAIKADLRHPGACHLYIHITEGTPEPERGMACAATIGATIPGASHINHMPSHTWTRMGRWGDAVRASLDAWHSDLKSQIGQGIAIYPWHDLEMLIFSASMDGQGAIAIQAARDYDRMTKNPLYVYLTLIRFGRFEDMLDYKTRPAGGLSGPGWDFASGYAHLRHGDAAEASVALTSLKNAAASSSAAFGANSARQVFGILAGILQGETVREQNVDAAISAFEGAVKIEDGLLWEEPEVLPFSPRHWLGAALLQAGRFADAEAVYRADLKKHPANGWSLLGLAQALNGQGKPTASAGQEFTASWARSDTWIALSRF